MICALQYENDWEEFWSNLNDTYSPHCLQHLFQVNYFTGIFLLDLQAAQWRKSVILQVVSLNSCDLFLAI